MSSLDKNKKTKLSTDELMNLLFGIVHNIITETITNIEICHSERRDVPPYLRRRIEGLRIVCDDVQRGIAIILESYYMEKEHIEQSMEHTKSH